MSEGTELQLTRIPVEIEATYELDAKDVAASVSPGEAANFVMDLDSEVGDWQTTCRLYHYFKAQFEICQKESPEDAAMTIEQLDDALDAADLAAAEAE